MPIGPVETTGQHLEWEVINTFRYHDDGRLAEEWVQTDYRSFLTKLGVTTTGVYGQAGKGPGPRPGEMAQARDVHSALHG